MNLVQINERLKDLPMQVIQQYANGMNPEVPPYLALGELQRREMSQKQMANQGGVQGPQPSVKEQVEQKAGLMALQQMQQQQMAQQQAMPRGPMPAPAGVPQPEQQPEMMARGGLASVPVRSDMFEYAGGGIVAFAGGGEVDAARAELRRALETLRAYGSRQRLQDPEGFKAAEAAVAKAQERRKQLESSYAQEMALGGADRPATSMRDVGRVPELSRQEAPVPAPPPAGRRMSPTEVAKMLQDPYATGKPIAPTGGLPAALTGATGATGEKPPAPPRLTAQPPAAMPPAAPDGLPAAAQSLNPYEDRLNELALKQPVAPTTQDAISRVSELSPAAMQEAALQKRNQEMRDRATGYMEKFEKGRPSGLDDLIRVFGQAGQYKGLSGLAPAYTSNKQQQRAEELAATKQFNEMMNLADKTEFEGSKEVFGARTRRDELASQLFGKEKEGVLKATSDLYTGKQRSLDEAANRLNALEVEKLRNAERRAERTQPGSAAMVRAEYLKMMDQVFALEDKGEKDKADALRRRAEARLTAGGGTGTAGVGADNAQTRKLRDAVKDIDSRLEFMDPKSPEFVTLQGQRDRLSKMIIERAIGEAGAGGGSAFTVTAGGKTYTFPTQEAANKFKAEAGVK
jgi:hypothetical protein